MIKKRGGQITVFIIIALVLILGFGVLMYVIQLREVVEIEEIIYPQEIQTVTNLIMDCARTAGKDAVILMGSQAGYIELPSEIEFERTSYLRMDEFGLYKIPYWYVAGESRVPPIDYMQWQIAQYVTNKTLECIDDFKAFEPQFQIISQEDLKVVTTLTEGDVLLELYYPLLISSGDKTFTVEDYNVFIPVRLKKVYDLAVDIMTAENEQAFFEKVTIDLMASHPDIPMDGMVVSCIQKQWFLPVIKQKLQKTIRHNIGRARIKNTGYPPFQADLSVYKKLEKASEKMWDEFVDGLEDYSASKNLPKERPMDAWDYFHLFYDVNTEPTDLRVAFEYHPDYGMDLNANPNDNGVLSTSLGEGAGALTGLLCIRQFHFVYDVQYPIKVIIRDPLSFEGEGYNFVFAFPVQVDDNEPQRIFTSTSFFPDVREAMGFCDFLGDEMYEFRARGFFAEDLPPGDLKDVTINYRCFNKFCTLGKTSAVRGVYRLVTPLPEGCANPSIIAEKGDYLKDVKFLTTKFMTLDLIKLKNFTFEVVKHTYNPRTDTLAVQADPLVTTELRQEKVAISLKLKGDRSFNQYKAFPSNETIQLVEDNAEYELNIYLVMKDKPMGGYRNQNLTITYSQLSQGNHIVFHVFDYADLTDELGLAQYLMGTAYQAPLKLTFEIR